MPIDTDTDITTLTPQQIDQALFDIYVEIGVTRARYEQAWATVRHYVHDLLGMTWREKVTDAQVQEVCAEVAEIAEGNEDDLTYRQGSLWTAMQRAEALGTKVDDLRMSCQPFDEEFDRRGGWTRAFLVITKGSGHVHSSMRCSTCYATTEFQWLPDLSDHDETEIIEKAGERACTVCYPHAPVEVLSRPTSIFSTEEISRAKAREEREEAKRQRAAKKLEKALLPDGTPLRVFIGMGPGYIYEGGVQKRVENAREKYETFETLHSAKAWLTDQAIYAAWGWANQPPQEARDAVLAAVAAKEGKTPEQVWEEAQARAQRRK